MEVAKVRLSQLCQHGELMDRYGANLRVLGNLGLLRPDLQEVIAQVTEITKHNTKYPLPFLPSLAILINCAKGDP